MNFSAPKLLIGCGLVLWGWQQQVLWAAIPMAILAECAPLIKTRIDISRKELNILFDMCAIFFAGLLVYGLVSSSGSRAIFLLVLWLPAVLFPMLLVQRYSSTWKNIPLTAISLKARKAKQTKKSIDISFLYLAAVIISASSSNTTPLFFYLSICALFLIVALKLRGKFYSIWPLLICLPLAGAGGYIIDAGIIRSQLYMEENIGQWFLDWFNAKDDPFRRDTRIGSIGSLKNSGKIIYRIKTENNEGPPKLIRDGSFDSLIGNTWSASDTTFYPLNSNNLLDWEVDSYIKAEIKPTTTTHAVISGYFDDNAVIATPIGTIKIKNLPAEKIEQTKLGTIKASNIPGMISYETVYSTFSSIDGEVNFPPKERDLHISNFYQQKLSKLSEKMQLQQNSPSETLFALKKFFYDNYSYSLNLSVEDNDLPPIVDFLFNTKSGHCEYFASATVLLLRNSGIPARYATGFSIQEYSDIENAWVAREYHAHAWALAYINGKWINVDNTPPVWLEMDKAEDSIFLSTYNLLSWARFAYNKWRMETKEVIPDSYIYITALILTIFFIWRLRKRRQQQTHTAVKNKTASVNADNPWLTFFTNIESKSIVRREHDTMFDWLVRCKPMLTDDENNKLKAIVCAYYAYRFDPEIDNNKIKSEIELMIKGYM